MSVIRIRNLADAPQHVEEVSRWLWEQWARADGYRLEDIVYRTRHAMGRRGVPQMLVAEEDGAPSAWSPSGTMTPNPAGSHPVARGALYPPRLPRPAHRPAAAGRLYRGRPRHRHL